MRVSEVKAGLTARVKVGAAVGILAAASLNAIPVAHATGFGIELNGTYRATSNGDWAKTNEVYMDEKTVVQTWTVTSSCISPVECAGEVRSDQGWSAPMRLVTAYWIIDRVVPNWAPCPDGTLAEGMQKFIIWGVNPAYNERSLKITNLLAGRDITKTASGACGVNRALIIEMPMRIEKLS
jgi:hypothetical protein